MSDKQPARSNRQLRLALIVFAVAALLAGALAWRLWVADMRNVRLETAAALRAVTDELSTRTRDEIQSLERMARRWERRGGVPKAEWEADAQEHLLSQVHFLALEWVDPENIVRWVVPAHGNEAAVGLDLDFEESRRTAAARARELRQPAATRPVSLVQGDVGVLLFVPMFTGDRFGGYIVGVHQIDRMLDELLANTAEGAAIRVDTGPGSEMLWTRGPAEDPAERWVLVDKIEVADKEWRIRVSPGPERVAPLRFGQSYIAGMGGLVIAALLAIAAALWDRTRVQAAEATAANHQLQAEVAAHRETEESLRRGKDEVEAIYRAHPDLIFRLDAGWCVLEYHAPEEDLFVAPDEFFGKDVRTVLPQPVSEALERAHAEAARTGKAGVVEYTLDIGDVRRHFEARIVSSGRDEILALIRDIDERARAEAVRRRFVDILQSTTDFVAIADARGRPTFVNRAGRAMLGLGEDEDLSAITLGMTRPPEDVKMLLEEALPAARRDGVWAGESTMLSRGGERIPVNQVLIAHGVEGSGDSNKVEFYSTIARDVRGAREAERERLVLETRFQEAQRRESLGVLAGGIAHDFNNLLVSVLGYADLALSELTHSSPGRMELEQIKKAALRAADLCNQMLAYSGGGPFQIRSFDLSEVVREMRGLLDVAIRADIEIVLDLPDEPVGVRGDVNQIRQIVMNLITNAAESFDNEAGRIVIRTSLLDATREDLAGYELDVRLEPRRYAVLQVIDAGSGMEEETRRKIFDPFFSTKFTGRGLGLSSVMGIADRHEGGIHVDSAPGQGTTFTVLLPSSSEEVEAHERDTDEPRGDAPEVTVLVVDDEADVRQVARMMLSRSGFGVEEASSGPLALECLERLGDRSCVVLLDVTMPGMGGYETAREIRSRFPQARILLSSGYTDLDAVRGASDVGAWVDGFVQKPYTRAALVKGIETVLST